MRREQLQLNIAAFKHEMGRVLQQLNADAGQTWQLMSSPSAIQPLLVGDNASALALAAGLQQAGFAVSAIRPPTVAVGTARLRFTLSAAHEAGDMVALAQALQTCAQQMVLRSRT